MLKRLCLAFAGLFLCLSPAYSAGTIGLSLTQRFDAVTAKPLNGGKLYFIQAGTTAAPQNAFQDSALTIPWPNPLTLDAGGNVPQLFFADGQIKIRLTNSAGVNQIVADNILVIGASSGGGGGGTVDPTTILATGDLKDVYGTGVLSGFVRCNGRTIGSVTSGATERANADTSALFSFLWTQDPNLTVSGGRGVSAAADFAANKTIVLPDSRGRARAGLDDMGNSAAGVITSTYFGATTTLGARGGSDGHILTVFEMPVHSHPNTLTDPGHSHTGNADLQGSSGSIVTTAALFGRNDSGVNSTQVIHISGATTGISINNANIGGGGGHSIMQPTILITSYIKL